MKNQILFWILFLFQINLFAQFTNYYAKPTGNIGTLSSWGTNSNGSGTQPTSFSANDCRFYIINRTYTPLTPDSNLILSGQNSVLVIGSSSIAASFIIPLGNSLVCDSLYIDSAVTLWIGGNITCPKPKFSKHSTVLYSGAIMLQPVLPGVYGKLLLYSFGGTMPWLWPDTYTKKLKGNIQVIDSLYIDCILYCDTFIVTIGESPAQPGKVSYNNTLSLGRVIGKMKRWFPASTTTGIQGLFPLGSQNNKHQFFYINQSISPSVGGLISVNYQLGSPGILGLPVTDTIFTSPVEFNRTVQGFWNVKIESGLTGASFEVIANPINMGGIAWLDALRLLKRDSINQIWQLFGGGFSYGSSSIFPYIGIPYVQNLNGQYTIASDSLHNYLPIELVSFKGSINQHQIELNWSTATEINAKEFVVSILENKQWTALKKIPAFGNSNTLRHYNCTLNNDTKKDEALLQLSAYDIDGTLSFSKQIHITSSNDIEEISLYPNPFSEQIQLQYFGSNQNHVADIFIYDQLGKVTLQDHIQFNHINTVDLNTSNIPAGLYVVKILQNGRSQNYKLMKY